MYGRNGRLGFINNEPSKFNLLDTPGGIRVRARGGQRSASGRPARSEVGIPREKEEGRTTL